MDAEAFGPVSETPKLAESAGVDPGAPQEATSELSAYYFDAGSPEIGVARDGNAVSTVDTASPEHRKGNGTSASPSGTGMTDFFWEASPADSARAPDAGEVSSGLGTSKATTATPFAADFRTPDQDSRGSDDVASALQDFAADFSPGTANDVSSVANVQEPTNGVPDDEKWNDDGFGDFGAAAVSSPSGGEDTDGFAADFDSAPPVMQAEAAVPDSDAGAAEGGDDNEDGFGDFGEAVSSSGGENLGAPSSNAQLGILKRVFEKRVNRLALADIDQYLPRSKAESSMEFDIMRYTNGKLAEDVGALGVEDRFLELVTLIGLEESINESLRFDEFESMIGYEQKKGPPITVSNSIQNIDDGLERKESNDSVVADAMTSDPFAFCGTTDLFSVMPSNNSGFDMSPAAPSGIDDDWTSFGADASDKSTANVVSDAQADASDWGAFGAPFADASEDSAPNADATSASISPSTEPGVHATDTAEDDWTSFGTTQAPAEISVTAESNSDWGAFDAANAGGSEDTTPGNTDPTNPSVPPADELAANASDAAEDDWSNFGATPPSLPTPAPVLAPTISTSASAESVPDARSGDSKWGAFDAMVSGGSEDTTPVNTDPTEPSVPPTAEPVASASDAADEDWTSFGATQASMQMPSMLAGPQAPAPNATADLPDARSGDSKWGAFDAMVSGSGDVISSQAAIAPPVPPPAAEEARTVVPNAADEDWTSFEATPEPEPAMSVSAESVSDVRSGDSKWGAFDAMVSGGSEQGAAPNADLAMSHAPIAEPIAPAQTSADSKPRPLGAADDDWTTFQATETTPSASAPTPADAGVEDSEWGDFDSGAGDMQAQPQHAGVPATQPESSPAMDSTDWSTFQATPGPPVPGVQDNVVSAAAGAPVYPPAGHAAPVPPIQPGYATPYGVQGVVGSFTHGVAGGVVQSPYPSAAGANFTPVYGGMPTMPYSPMFHGQAVMPQNGIPYGFRGAMPYGAAPMTRHAHGIPQPEQQKRADEERKEKEEEARRQAEEARKKEEEDHHFKDLVFM